MTGVIKIKFYFILYFIEETENYFIQFFYIQIFCKIFTAIFHYFKFSLHTRFSLFNSHFMPIIFRSLSHECVSTTASVVTLSCELRRRVSSRCRFVILAICYCEYVSHVCAEYIKL